MWKKYLKELNLPESYVSLTLGFLVIIVGGLLLYNSFIKKEQPEGEPEEVLMEEKQIEEIQAALPSVHTVSANENLWTIAEKYYNSGYNWVSIASENNLKNPDKILVGQTLTIPKAEVIKPIGEKILAKAEATEAPKTYTVVRDDSLWKIAVREYGDGYAWTKIAQANNLANPDLIHAGNVLRLPR